MSTQRSTEVAPAVPILLGVVAASLAVMSCLHLTGQLTGRPPFTGYGAGIAEAVIAVVLAGGVVVAYRDPANARLATLAANAFAIVGFLVGLSFTLRGGSAVDLAYHAVGLPCWHSR